MRIVMAAGNDSIIEPGVSVSSLTSAVGTIACSQNNSILRGGADNDQLSAVPAMTSCLR
jgi:hypothetical protein